METAKVDSNLVLARGGSFRMGSSEYDIEKPVHSVTVSSFYMGKYEVTQKEWREVMGSGVRQQRDKANPDWPLRGEGDNNPMYYVSWNEAVEYCNKLSRKEGLTPCYSGSGNSRRCNFSASGYRLPTEAEWEYAARGGNSSRGYTYAGGNSISSLGWYDDNSNSKTHPVGQKKANELGLYDMSGNVWEWCWDWKGSYSSGSRTDPTGPSSGSHRMIRGGGWDRGSRACRSANRLFSTPSRRGGSLGFRVVRRP
ncbi:Formylglycine-generating enzyme [subsurface metagenome]